MNGAQEVDFEEKRLAWIDSQMPDDDGEEELCSITCECCGCEGECSEEDLPIHIRHYEKDGKRYKRLTHEWVCEDCVEALANDPDLQWEFFDTEKEREELKRISPEERMEWVLDNRSSFVDFLIDRHIER